ARKALARISRRSCRKRIKPRTLKPFAADETRQVPRDPHRVAHQEAFERRETIDCGEPDIARELDRGKRIREQYIEAVGDRCERQRIEAAPLLVAQQHCLVSYVEAKAPSVDYQLRQRGDVAYGEVEPLSGDRVD